MAARLWKLARENAGAAVSVLSLLGFGSVVALLDDAREMLVGHPGASAALAAAAFACGAGLTSHVLVRGRCAQERAKVETLSRAFAGMSPRRREMVRTALDKGEVRTWSMDEDALALCNMGILGGPPIVPRTGEAGFSIQPAVVFEVRDHCDEWLGA